MPERQRTSLIMSTQVYQELQSELALIQKYVKRTSTGKVKTEVCPTGIRLSVVGSKEMST